MKLGVDVFSLRSQGWDAFEHLDYADEIGLDVVHFSDLAPFESLDEGYLRDVKSKADDLGLDIEAGMGSICPTSTTFHDDRGTAGEQVKEMLGIAEILGSPVLRCLLGSNADRHTEEPLETHIQSTVDTCKAVESMAKDLGIKLAIENHAGDLQGRELKELIERAGPEHVGACIDSGNPLWIVEDPMVTLEHLAPYVVTSHVRDTAVWSHPDGAAVQWVAMGDGNIGIREWSARYKELCPDIPFTLEIITGGTARVLNYMEPEFWEVFPDTPAAEFARFERLVRDGEPFIKPMLTVNWRDMPEGYASALAIQQRLDLERSVVFCKQELSVGEK